MKILNKLIIVLFAAMPLCVFSQSFVMDLTYTRWENDLNKTYRSETYSVSGRTLTYGLDYEGKSMPNEVDEAKTCELQNLAYEQLLKAVYNNKLNRDEFIYRKERRENDNVFYLKISLSLVIDGIATSILLDGESNLVMDNKTYLDLIKFIKELRVITRDC